MKELFDAIDSVDLGARPTPVERCVVDGLPILVKRDDLIGGNKTRCLEYLLTGDAERVLTISTLSANHALATTRCARRLGWETDVVLVDMGLPGAAYAALDAATVREVGGAWGAALETAKLWRPGVRFIPPGGASARGALGYARAVFELDEIPERIYVPLGTGTTAAGLLAGLMLRRACCEVVGVRVSWRPIGIWHRAKAAARLLGQRAERGSVRLRVVAAAGSYGEPTEAWAAARARDAGLELDATYAAKAMGVLLRERPRNAMFVLTYARP